MQIDALISDPPYGIGYQHSGGGNGIATARNANVPIHGDDEPFDPAPLLEIAEITLLFGADHFARRLPESGSFHAWDKVCGRPFKDSFSDVEFIWASWPGKASIFHHMWKGVCREADEEKGQVRVHPSLKPVALMKWCIGMADAEAKRRKLGPVGTILDPYAGAGSTGRAAKDMGRRAILIEIEERHCEAAARRMRQEVLALEFEEAGA
jgi:site-specific DNA-methyltransferase (adenine-specific)/modification methylase